MAHSPNGSDIFFKSLHSSFLGFCIRQHQSDTYSSHMTACLLPPTFDIIKAVNNCAIIHPSYKNRTGVFLGYKNGHQVLERYNSLLSFQYKIQVKGCPRNVNHRKVSIPIVPYSMQLSIVLSEWRCKNIAIEE